MKTQNNKSKMLKKLLQNLIFSLSSIISLIACLPTNGTAQLTTSWTDRYNGSVNGEDIANAIVVDGLGNVYVTGQSTGNGTQSDYATIKYNSNGVIQWVKRYSGLSNGSIDIATSIAVDGSGNVYVTGYSGSSLPAYDIATIKYNSLGVMQWVQRFNGQDNGRDEAYSMAVDAYGNVYVTGRSERSGAGTNADYVTVKYSTSGVQQWVAIYNGPGDIDDDRANSIAVDASGNVYVTGRSGGSGTNYDYATVKYNQYGTQLWVARYNGPNNNYDEAKVVKVDASGNVYVTGTSGNFPNCDYATVKYNSLGVQQWAQRFNGQDNGNDEATGLAVDASGNVYVSGFSLSATTHYDFATVKYSSNGISQWVNRYNDPANGYDVPKSLVMDNSGNLYLTGFSTESFAGVWYYYYTTIKINSAGTTQWTIQYNGSYAEANSIAVDGVGNVYVTGSSGNGGGDEYDYVTIKYSQNMTGISPSSNEIPKDYCLSQNFPNPFNPSTTIRFNIPADSKVRLAVYDILGKEVDMLANEQLKAGAYEVNWNASNFPSGAYFYKLITDGFVETKKMMLVK